MVTPATRRGCAGIMTFWMTRASSRSCSRSFSMERSSEGNSKLPMSQSGGESRTARGAALGKHSRRVRAAGNFTRGLLPIVFRRRRASCEWTQAEENGVMRALALVLVAALILFGVYQFYLKKMPTTDAGTAK